MSEVAITKEMEQQITYYSESFLGCVNVCEY